jgi:GNAT superfamily N-acetyltransferase
LKVLVRERVGDALSLVERVHAGGRPLAGEYPLVFGADGPGRVVVAEERGRVVSACAVLERVLRFPDAAGVTRRLQVGLVGSVTTAEDARGRGLAGAVLERAEAELARSGCALAMLWADDPRFYQRRGYREVGAELDLVLSTDVARRLPTGSEVSTARPADVAALHALHRSQGRRTERSLEETRALLATPGMTTAVARDDAGRPLAYACLGRGHDLEGVVHEWAGEPEAVLRCLRALHAGRGPAAADLYLMAPPELGEVQRRLSDLGAPAALGVLAMARVLDPGALLAAVVEAGRGGVSAEGPDARGELELRGPAGLARRRPEELLDALLPARLDPAPLRALEAELGAALPGLPWAPFLWGLDSI